MPSSLASPLALTDTPPRRRRSDALDAALLDEWARRSDEERAALAALLEHRTRTPPPAFAEQPADTLGDRLADRIAAFGGSWTFIALFVAALAAWVLLNTELLGPRQDAFDPYPYVFLNLILSMLAAVQAPIILMAQNRAAARDRASAMHDYLVNLRAEREIRYLHEKLDALREAQWEELVRLQHEQLQRLDRLIAPGPSPR